MTTRVSRRTFLGTAAATTAWSAAVGADAGGAASSLARPEPLKLGVASYSFRNFTLDRALDDGQDPWREVHDVQGRSHAADRPAGDDPRAPREDRGGRHHDHGRGHDHAAQRPGADPQGFRIREERRLPADLRVARSGGHGHHRADGEGVRHQGGDSQPRPGGQGAGRGRRTPTPR